MSQDLRSRIRAAAQERGIDPEIAINFAQAESSLNPNAKAKTSSASGLFQVINKTWKEYGGRNKNDINEQIRVGTDIIASNQASFKRKFNREPSAAELYAYHVLGPTGAPQLLRADPAMPMQKVVSPEAYKANPAWHGKRVADIMGTYEKKVGGSGKAPVATGKAVPKQRASAPSFPPLTQMDIDQMGPNYKAALAAMTLADTSDEDDDEGAGTERVMDKMAENDSMVEEEAPMSTAAIRDIGMGQTQPVLMAKGGEARKMMDAVYRADGSPEYGEISMGDFSGDTRQQLKDALTKRGRATTKEDLKILSRLPVEAASNVESFTRGSVAALPGMVGDVEAAFRTDPKKQIFPTTEKILKSVPRITPANERSAGFEEIGTYDIGLPGAALAKGVSKVPGALKAAAPVVGAALADATVPKLLQPMFPENLSGRMYAVKPTGGVFYPKDSGSRIDDYLSQINKKLESTDIPGKEAKAVMELIKDKGYKYFSTTYGTKQDPLREAVLDGRLSLSGNDTEILRDYALAAAREGHPNAIKDLEKAYDDAAKLQGTYVKVDKDKFIETLPPSSEMLTSSKLEKLMPHTAKTVKQAEIEKMIKEGVDPEHINIKTEERNPRDLTQSYLPEANQLLGAILEGSHKAPLSGAEKSIKYAADKGEYIYDLSSSMPDFEFLKPSVVARGIATIPVSDLKNMTFPEMVIRGAQNTLLDRNADVAIDRLKAGKDIPKKFYTEGVTPVKGLQDTGWHSIDSLFGVRLEGAAMHHSIGDYAKPGTAYGHGGREGFLSGKAKVYSLRPDGYKPTLTVETGVDPKGVFVSQVKGPFNSAPTLEEKQKVFQLFDLLRPYDFKNKESYVSTPERYTRDRQGENIPEMLIDWKQEYQNYLKYLNKEIE